MFSTLRVPQFRLLFGGHLISLIGDYALLVALPVWVYASTGSAAASGGVFLAATVPQLFLSPIAGAFVDRWERKRTLIVADALRAALVLGMLIVPLSGSLALLYLLVLLQSSVSRFFFPARTAILPDVVRREQLGAANAALSFGDALGRLAGPALGGLLAATSGITASIALDALSYIVSAILLAHLDVAPATAQPDRPARSLHDAGGRMLRDLLDGVRMTRSQPALRMLVGVAALLSIGQGVISVLLVVLVATAWGGAAPELGLLTSAQGLGALAGGLLAATLAVRMQPRSLIALGAFGSGALLLVMTNQSTLGVALALYGVIGVMAVALQVGVGTVMQLETPAEYRGRFSSLLSTAGAATTLVAMALTSLLAGIVDVRLMFDVAAVAFLVGGGLAFGRPVLRRIDSPVAVVPRGS